MLIPLSAWRQLRCRMQTSAYPRVRGRPEVPFGARRGRRSSSGDAVRCATVVADRQTGHGSRSLPCDVGGAHRSPDGRVKRDFSRLCRTPADVSAGRGRSRRRQEAKSSSPNPTALLQPPSRPRHDPRAISCPPKDHQTSGTAPLLPSPPDVPRPQPVATRRSASRHPRRPTRSQRLPQERPISVGVVDLHDEMSTEDHRRHDVRFAPAGVECPKRAPEVPLGAVPLRRNLVVRARGSVRSVQARSPNIGGEDGRDRRQLGVPS